MVLLKKFTLRYKGARGRLSGRARVRRDDARGDRGTARPVRRGLRGRARVHAHRSARVIYDRGTFATHCTARRLSFGTQMGFIIPRPLIAEYCVPSSERDGPSTHVCV